MDFRDVGGTWMDAGERKIARRFATRLRAMLAERGVAESPLLALRVADVVKDYVLLLRCEAALQPSSDATESPLPLEKLLDAIGKQRERLRRAMKELEDFCSKAGVPIDTGIADLVKPLMASTKGILEASHHKDTLPVDATDCP